ncbi:hypothetical protein [Sulfurovum riftiae]|uniref:Porin n=1 Tax=Sulfurovum riftiae TaxID=1630136 RepID=A0A151CIP8_9BACT|nr:hypothetical protein [Sulfurovum riftiae]KYJ87314.1 hypothetical protein AS592_09320 [Sulfurovum riftiae]
MKRSLTTLSLAVVLIAGANAASLEERVAALEEQNKVLTEEVLAEQTGGFTAVDVTQSYNGMGAAASKVYYSQNPLSIGGYGEMYYANPDNGDDYANVYRFVTYFGYKFSDNVILNAEIEYEHGANAEEGGEVVMEFMYLDFLMREEVNLRLGHLLVPMGIIGLRHEPTLFNTVQRPEIERYLIPTTWHENGALLYGRFEGIGLEYTAGVVNTLNMNTLATADASEKWIRDGRQGAFKKGAFDPAFVGRLDYTGINSLTVGASLYYGGASNLKDGYDKEGNYLGDISGLTTTMFDLHAMYNNGPFSAYGLYTQTTLDGAQKIGNGAVEKGSGYYANAAYDIGSLTSLEYKVPLFVQYENYNPVAKSVDGFNEEKYKTEKTTIGLNFFPVNQAVIKADYAMKDVNNVEENIFSLGIGFIF